MPPDSWFVDATPYDDTEFEIIVTETHREASQSSEAFGRIDLLTVVMHELGHVLGKAHEPNGVMLDTLAVSTRVYPGHADESEDEDVFVAAMDEDLVKRLAEDISQA